MVTQSFSTHFLKSSEFVWQLLVKLTPMNFHRQCSTVKTGPFVTFYDQLLGRQNLNSNLSCQAVSLSCRNLSPPYNTRSLITLEIYFIYIWMVIHDSCLEFNFQILQISLNPSCVETVGRHIMKISGWHNGTQSSVWIISFNQVSLQFTGSSRLTLYLHH